MQRLTTQLDTQSEVFQENQRAYADLMTEYRNVLRQVTQEKNPKSAEKHKSRGKLLARERINQLIDPNTPFLELLAAGRLRDARPISFLRRASWRELA